MSFGRNFQFHFPGQLSESETPVGTYNPKYKVKLNQVKRCSLKKGAHTVHPPGPKQLFAPG